MIRWLGTTYRLHPLFVLLMLLSVLTGYFTELLTLFAVVAIHELGHLTAAKALGWRVKEVQLLPFGGVAVMEESGNVPVREELFVALAGPLQNVWMMLLAALMKTAGWFDAAWWDYFFQANLIICLFNLLPVLPLDGGRVTQALFCYAMSYHRALVATAWLGLGMSVCLVVASIVRPQGAGVQLNLLAIALFLAYSNWYGLRGIPYTFMRFLVSREARTASKIVKGALVQPIVVPGNATVADTLRLFMREKYHLVYVLGGSGRIQRVLPEQAVVDFFFHSNKPGCAVADIIL